MYVQQKYTLLVEKSVNVFLAITTLFSSMSFAATDIFFEVVMAGTAVKTLRMTISSMPCELRLLFKISINLCHFFSGPINFHDTSHIKLRKILDSLLNKGVPITSLCQKVFLAYDLSAVMQKAFRQQHIKYILVCSHKYKLLL